MENRVVSVEELNNILVSTPFLKPYGFNVKTCAGGECTVCIPFMHSAKTQESVKKLGDLSYSLKGRQWQRKE